MVYLSPSSLVTKENFPSYDVGRYLFISKSEFYTQLTFAEIDIFYTPALCTVCSKDSYCVGGNANTSQVCPNSTYSLYQSSSASQCGCPVNSSLVQDRGCVCMDGTYKMLNGGKALAGWQCSPCLPGSFCTGGVVAGVCPNNTYCPIGTIVPIQCPALSVSSSNSSALGDCLCPDGYARIGSECVICGYGTYSSKGAVATCTNCPANSNTSSLGSTSFSQCKCISGYVGDVATPGTMTEPSIIRSCNGLMCPVTALNFYDFAWTPDRAVDGTTDLGWHSKDISESGVGYNWWRIDFQTTRWISKGWIHNTLRPGKLAGYQIWIGYNSTFPGNNVLKYASNKPGAYDEYFPVSGYGRYLYVVNNQQFLCIDEINIFTGDPPQCNLCPVDYYCPGNKTNYTIPCPNSMYSPAGSFSLAQCACPVNAALLPDVNCTCNGGY